MIEILLVFAINGSPEDVSDRIFESKQECSEFVNTLAEASVVKQDGSFGFVSSDGHIFRGACISKKAYQLKNGKFI